MFNVGILGAGWIARKMAETLAGTEGVRVGAIASREKAKADAFATEWGIGKAYGSYKELVEDPDIDLVYIATPHSHHFQHASLAIEAGRPVLCEKAFTANAREAGELLDLAHKKGVFITEAIWTRYMPLSLKVRELIEGGAIGTPRQISASLCYSMRYKERILRPELCGGALMDLGVYAIHFARMYFGSDIERVDSSCLLSDTGIDLFNSIEFYYRDGRVANLQSSALSRCNREGLITGDDGYIVVENINCPECAKVYNDYKLVAEYGQPTGQVTGYEYQVLACRDAIAAGLPESPYISHQETYEVMAQMDALRAEWGVVFPNDKV